VQVSGRKTLCAFSIPYAFNKSFPARRESGARTVSMQRSGDSVPGPEPKSGSSPLRGVKRIVRCRNLYDLEEPGPKAT
jgi:hypothetical protein